MVLLEEYHAARRDADIARLRRVIALRAMLASGMSQREAAQALGITQPAVSQQLAFSPDSNAIHPELLLEAAAPVLLALAEENGYTRLAVFGSAARGEARQDSDLDLVVQAPPGTSSFSFLRFKKMIEQTLGREIDLASYDGLRTGLDDDILHEARLL